MKAEFFGTSRLLFRWVDFVIITFRDNRMLSYISGKLHFGRLPPRKDCLFGRLQLLRKIVLLREFRDSDLTLDNTYLPFQLHLVDEAQDVSSVVWRTATSQLLALTVTIIVDSWKSVESK